MTTNHKDLKSQRFLTYTIEDWATRVKDSFKNNTTVESLAKETYEDIKLKPLYTQEDINFLDIDQFPGAESNARGFGPLKNQQTNWHISQRIYKNNWDEAKYLLNTAINNGQDTVSFHIDSLNNVGEVDFQQLHLDFSQYPFFLTTKNHHKLILEKAEKVAVQNPFGVIASDMISSELDKGKIGIDDQTRANDWAELLQHANDKLPSMKTILVDTTPYHNGGANAVQELAIALCEAVFYIEWMKKFKWTPEETINKLVFHFGIGGNFFMELTKIRAFRVLWTTIEKAYNLTLSQGVIVSAETSSFTKSSLDPYVNILRSGNEAFAAILGGVQYLHVTPFDEIYQENDDFSARIARNIQLILKEETYVNKVVDPAGGSYYIETLTYELVEKSWELFQNIDAMGGIIEVLKSGWMQNEINQILNRRLLDVETRKQTIVGTNVYVDPTERNHFNYSVKIEENMNVIPIHSVRLSLAFEKLRERAFHIQNNGISLVAGLICLGSLKEYKQRADYVSSVLATGGIHSEWSVSCLSLEDIKSYIAESQYPYYCICGSNERYRELALLVGKWVKEHYPSIQLDIAGTISQADMSLYYQNGISDSVHLHQNIIGKLTNLLNLWEV